GRKTMSLSTTSSLLQAPLPIPGLSTPMENFTSLRRLRLANLSTPIERANRLRKLIPGAPEIFIKRDDLTGYFGGGNKLRKLEYVMADALATGATAVITNGSITSNLARTTAVVAKRLGLKCVVVFDGGGPKTARDNSRIAELLNVEVYSVASRQERDDKMEEVAHALELNGERVYRIPL